MTTFLKQFRLAFTVEGPVFVGSGEKRTAKEYVVGKGVVYFPDMDRLYGDVESRDLAASFEEFMLDQGARPVRGGQRSAAQRLHEWMKANRVPPSLKVHGGYWIAKGDFVTAKARSTSRERATPSAAPELRDIHMFVKDAFGLPYLPGSSIKGLLRTMFLEHSLLNQKPGTPGAIPIHGVIDDAATVEARFLRLLKRPDTRPDDAVNDAFQAIRVRDSMPLSTASLIVCQKMDGSVGGEVSGLPLHRECLKPGTSFSVDVTVDIGLWPRGADFVQDIAQVAETINAARYVPYVNKYEIDGLKAARSGSYVYLGGGAGFRSKTFVNDQATMSRILDGQFRKIRHVEKTKQLGVSPLALKLTKVDGVLYEMGKCRLTVQPSRAG